MAWKDGETISPLGLNRIEEAVASMNESYTPTVWQVGDVITAEKLNKIEEGIANAGQPSGKKEIMSTAEVNVASYATAQVVDEDLVAGNIKKDVDILGVVGSYEGGGTSDFSTVEVVIINNSNSNQTLDLINLYGDATEIASNITVQDNGTKNILAVLYKNNPVTGYLTTPEGLQMAFSGDIADDGDGYFIISGAGTITITETIS